MKGNKLWWDDYSIVGALFLTYGQNFLSFFSATHSGYGKHIIALTYEQITEFVKIQWVSQLVFGCATTVIKLSILLLYYRIFPSRKFKIAFMAVGGLNVAFFIAHTLSVLFSCAPISYNWDKSIPGGHCINLNSLAYGITGAGFITDICIWLLPLPWLWGLQMKLPRKLAVIGIFCLGGLVCLASIIRLPLLTKVNFIDATWTIVDPAIWLLVECNIGIVCACLPIMRPLLQSFAPCVGIRTHGSRNLQTISPFSSRWTRQSKYNRSGSHSGSGTGSSKGLKGSSDPIVVEHELDIASHKGSIKPADNAGFYTTAMPSIVGRSDEKDSV
ncbi:hypothetical protein MMC30_004131 [Trapelia coarctata]|nr:hypothetical protein [Trapelia coarctata]